MTLTLTFTCCHNKDQGKLCLNLLEARGTAHAKSDTAFALSVKMDFAATNDATSNRLDLMSRPPNFDFDLRTVQINKIMR